MQKSLPVFLCLFIFPLFVAGQSPALDDNAPMSASRPVELTVGNHSISMPFRKMLRTPFHPAISAGTELAFKHTAGHKIYSPLRFEFFYNKYNAAGLKLTAGIGYRYTHKIGVFADVAAEAGYLHSFRTFGKMTFKDGYYESMTDFGKPAANAGFHTSLGYDFFRRTDLPLAVFVRYEWFAQIPYNSYAGNYRPQAVISVGLRWDFAGDAVKCPPGAAVQ